MSKQPRSGRTRSAITDPGIPLQTTGALDEPSAAAWYESQGARVREHRGRMWVSAPRYLGGGTPGFWVPVAGVAPLQAREIGRPSPGALGYRAVVAEADQASGAAEWEFVNDLPTFDSHRLARDRVRSVRRALERLEFRNLADDPGPLIRSGFALATAAQARVGGHVADNPRLFERRVLDRFAADPQLIVGAFHDDKLVAYAMSHAIGAMAHFTYLCAPKEGMALGASDGLYWCTLKAWSATPGIAGVNLGMKLHERPGITAYKASFGAEPAVLPVIGWVRWPLRPYLRALRPLTASRLGISRQPQQPVT